MIRYDYSIFPVKCQPEVRLGSGIPEKEESRGFAAK